MRTRAVDYLVRAVSALGVRHIFGVDGANIEDLYDAIFDAPDHVTGVIAKHEFSAATMADGYARTTGGLGVVAATSGGGAMNLVAGLAESFASRVPVLALVGQPPTLLEGNGAFQDTSGRAGAIDAVRLFGAVSNFCARVESAADLPDQLDRAVHAARRGGPGVLLLPKDVQQADLSGVAPLRPAPGRHRSDQAAIGRVRAALSTARQTGKIVIVAGDQVARDDARAELARLATALNAAVGVAPDAKDTYDNTDPGFCGVAGTMGHPELAAAIRSSALCLLVGTRMPVPTRAGLETSLADRTVASIGVAPPYLPAIHATSTDLSRTLADLADALDDGSTGSEHVRAAQPPTSLRVPASTGPGLRYREVVETIDAALPEGTDVFADAGNTGAAVVHHLRVPRDGRFVVALGMGGMGYAFGAGIGSAFARHARTNGVRRTVVIAGDGAFYMHGMELHTAIEHALPVTFVVLNNNAHAMCVTREQLYYRDRYSFNRFRPAHLGSGVAAMFPGLPAFSAHTVSDLDALLRRCLETEGPSFLSIECDPDEIPPFLPFLTTVEQSRNPR
ncbi:thiamine pyrophosphate-binding protein [Nocardia abscessus]|uniref:thiamine pyrophosphate-binding protein n=1 Tax=Nocardia abscessus TaxID=120957 RepID=UPI0018939134|nr:thiamine pyrophosphate-binding protein [Nocardia abscessus]MBF6334773.1 thiamine pyrophosphate-binding protein [Nocardia abscessus]